MRSALSLLFKLTATLTTQAFKGKWISKASWRCWTHRCTARCRAGNYTTPLPLGELHGHDAFHIHVANFVRCRWMSLIVCCESLQCQQSRTWSLISTRSLCWTLHNLSNVIHGRALAHLGNWFFNSGWALEHLNFHDLCRCCRCSGRLAARLRCGRPACLATLAFDTTLGRRGLAHRTSACCRCRRWT